MINCRLYDYLFWPDGGGGLLPDRWSALARCLLCKQPEGSVMKIKNIIKFRDLLDPNINI